MKKIFLVFGIIAFADATAQQQELFDIQKKVKEKIAADKKALEKQSLLLPFQKKNIPAVPESMTDNVYSLANGDKLVLLTPGNMPCIKPDMQLFQAMPNLALSKPGIALNYYTIPNPAIPRQRF